MGSSARKKGGKKADFQKPKLKVGKARPKPTNFTDTSFKSKSISVPTQTLHTASPSQSIQITTHISHLHSHSGSLRQEHLGALHTLLSTQYKSADEDGHVLPIPYAVLLNAVNPMILDMDNRVRAQLIKMYGLIPLPELAESVEKILPYIRAGLVHLSADIRTSSLDLLGWMLEAKSSGGVSKTVYLGDSIVSCAGGWLKGLRSFMTILGWQAIPTDSAPATGAVHLASSSGSRAASNVKTMHVLTKFLRSGLHRRDKDLGASSRDSWAFPLRNLDAHWLPTRSNAFAYLNLFDVPRDEDGQIFEDVQERQRVFRSLGFEACIQQEATKLKKEGGELGRAAGLVLKISSEV